MAQDLTYELQLKIDSVNKTLSQLSSVLKGFESTTESIGKNAGKSLGNGITSGLEGVGSRISRIFDFAIGSAIGGLINNSISAIQNSIGTQIDSAKGLESTRTALNGIIGDSKKAGDLLKEVVKFASETPFEIPELADTAKQLASSGFSSDEIVGSLKRLGDIASGTGTPLSQIAFVYGQIKTANKAYNQDLNQLQNAGIPIYQELAKQLGVASDEVKELSSKGKIGFAEVDKVLVSLTGTGGRFSGAMALQSKTLGGLLSTLNDTFGGISRKILGLSDDGEVLKNGLFDKIRQGTASLIDFLNQPVNLQFFTGIGRAIKTTISAVEDVISIFKGENIFEDSPLFNLAGFDTSALPDFLKIVKDSVQSIYDIFTIDENTTNGIGITADQNVEDFLFSIANFLQDIKLSIQRISEIGVFNFLVESLSTLQPYLQPVIDFFSNIIKYVNQGNILFTAFNQVIGALQTIFAFLLPVLAIIGTAIGFFIAQAISLAQSLFTTLYPAFLNIVQALGNLFEAVSPVIAVLVLLAGVVTGALLVAFSVVFPIIASIVAQVISSIATIFSGLINVLSGVINFISGVFVALFTGNFRQLQQGTSQILQGIVQLFQGLGALIISPFRGAWDGVISVLKGIDLFKIGVNIIEGLINGVKSMASSLINSVTGAVNGAIDGAKKLLGINSPSKVFMQFGQFTGQGFVNGLENMQKKIGVTVDDIFSFDQLTSQNQQPVYNNTNSSNSVTNTTNNTNNQRTVNNYSQSFNGFNQSIYNLGY